MALAALSFSYLACLSLLSMDPKALLNPRLRSGWRWQPWPPVDSLTHPEMLAPVKEGHSGSSSATDKGPGTPQADTHQPHSFLPESFKECYNLACDPA